MERLDRDDYSPEQQRDIQKRFEDEIKRREEAHKKSLSTLQSGDYIRDQSARGLRNAQNRQAPQMQGAQVGNVYQGRGATINQAPQADWRMRELAMADRMNAIANGSQMGAGELAARREGMRAQAQQQAYARSQRGGDAALAARSAATNSANIGLNVAGQAAQARATDQQMANQTMTGLMAQGRGADIGLATSQAGLTQQMNLANLDAQNQRVFQQAGLNQATSLANMQSRLQMMGMNDAASLAYLSQLFGVDQAEMNARLSMELGKPVEGPSGLQKAVGAGLVVGGTVIGGIYGGAPGAAAGGAAGSQVAGNL